MHKRQLQITIRVNTTEAQHRELVQQKRPKPTVFRDRNLCEMQIKFNIYY